MDVLLLEYGRPRYLVDDPFQVVRPVGLYGLRRNAGYHRNSFVDNRHESPVVDQVQIVLEPFLEHQLLDLLHRQSEGEDAGVLGVLVPCHKRIREGVVGVHEVYITLVMSDRIVICFDGFFPGTADQGLPVLFRDTDDDPDGASQEAQRIRKQNLGRFFIGAVRNPVLSLPDVQDEDVERGAGRVVVRLLHESLDGALEPFDGFFVNHIFPFFCYYALHVHLLREQLLPCLFDGVVVDLHLSGEMLLQPCVLLHLVADEEDRVLP